MEHVHLVQNEGLPYVQKSFRDLGMHDHVAVHLNIGLEINEYFKPQDVFFTAITPGGLPVENRSNPMPITNDRLAICSVFTGDSLVWVYYDDVLETYLLLELLIEGVSMVDDMVYGIVNHIIPLSHTPTVGIHLARVATHAIRFIDQHTMVPFNLQAGYRAHMKVMFSEQNHFAQRTEDVHYKTINQNVQNLPYIIGTYIFDEATSDIIYGLLVPFRVITMERLTTDRPLLDRVIQFMNTHSFTLAWLSPNRQQSIVGSIDRDITCVMIETTHGVMLVPLSPDETAKAKFTTRQFLMTEFRDMMIQYPKTKSVFGEDIIRVEYESDARI